MLHKTVVLANLQVFCPLGDTKIGKIAGQLRNLFYAASFPWSEGNLGRVIPISNFEDFYGEFKKLRDDFYEESRKLIKPGCNVTLSVLPFPNSSKLPTMYPSEELLRAPDVISAELEKRFERRIRMLLTALQEEKRFYASLLSELEKIIETGIYLAGRASYGKTRSITPQLFARLRAARSSILIHSAERIRQSASLREAIINYCGALI